MAKAVKKGVYHAIQKSRQRVADDIAKRKKTKPTL